MTLEARSATVRTALAMTAFSVWMLLLLSGWVLGGAVYLLLAAALALFPWRWLRTPAAPESGTTEGGER